MYEDDCRILFPTDFSEASHQALGYAIHLAQELDGSVCLLHFHQSHAAEQHLKGPAFMMAEKEQKERLEGKMDDFLGDAKIRVPFQYHLRTGRFAPEITKMLKDKAYKFLVLVAQANHSFADFLFGNPVESIIEHTKTPVLVIPPGTEFEKIKHIVYATNFIDDHLLAIQQLDDFALAFSSQITFLQIDDHITENDKRIAAKYTRALTKLLTSRFHLEVIEDNSVANRISQYLHDEKADLLVMLKKERGLARKLLHNSLITKMLSIAKKPILILQEESTLGN